MNEEAKRNTEENIKKLEKTEEQDAKERRKANKKKRAKETREATDTYEAMRVEDTLGMVIKGKWKDIEAITAKDAYEKLSKKRMQKMQKKKGEKVATNHAMTTIRKKLSPGQREFWWKIAHRAYTTNSKLHKWKVDGDIRHTNMCVVCGDQKETWEHMEFECTELQKWIEMLEEVYEEFMEKKKQLRKEAEKEDKEKKEKKEEEREKEEEEEKEDEEDEEDEEKEEEE